MLETVSICVCNCVCVCVCTCVYVFVCACECLCVMPSGKETFHHNVTPAATEREVNTQGRGTQGSVCACV